MLEGFYCPDGEKVKLEDCLAECRLGEKCLTTATLVAMSQEREWNGVASTTQLLNGTMLELLKLTQPYYVDPDSRAFMLQGTKHHAELEEVGRALGLAVEVALSVDRNIFDLVEFEGTELVLTDYKLWGSFRVAKALGIVETGKQPHPTDVYKTTGKWGKAGSPKMVPVFSQVPEQADNLEAELQLNRYRVMLERLGMHVHKMRLQATVRDGGLAVAKSRGLFRNIYKIPVQRLDDEGVENYFIIKDSCLKEALAVGQWNTPCTAQESWDGRRCEDYCDVWEHCPKGKLVHGIGGN